MASPATRADDERVLAWLAATKRGETSITIAAAWGVYPEQVRSTISRMRRADLAESGEPQREVLAGYR